MRQFPATIPAFYFDSDQLAAVADRYREQFKNAQPFPHVAIDQFLPPDIIRLLIDEFPGPTDIDWKMWGPGAAKHTQDPNIEKLGTSDERKFGAFTRHFMSQLNSATFIEFVESLTGLKGIVPDPSYHGCGLHSTGRGGRLMVHTDSSRHHLGERFHQHFNMIFYLNEDWQDEYGGHLELWDREGKNCVKRIAPVANRMVIFDTGPYSYHGHPHPLTCPQGRRRNSLAVYYYVIDRPHDLNYTGYQTHVDWVPLNDEERAVLAEREARRRSERRRKKVRAFARKLVPPIVFDIAKGVRQDGGRS